MTPSFNAWKVGAPYYGPLLAAGVAMLVLFGATPYWYLAAAIFLAGICALLFFRDPPRAIAGGEEGIVSPADGTVVAIEDLDESDHYDGASKRVSIFLSIFNVHVNRAPAACTVREIRHRAGRYKNAMNPESSVVNESNALWIDTAHGPMTVRQISGAVARRIVCISKEGENLAKGQKFGMIKFGSRTELYLPPHAEICVRLKDKVRAGTSIIATMSEKNRSVQD